MTDAERIEELERRTAALEKAVMGKETQEVLELNLTLPEADINGLHFNKQEVHAVFEKKEDGWYHSRDILFMSARNTRYDNSRDILTEYLNRHEDSGSIRAQIALEMKAARVPDVEIALPQKNEGVKQYNGVDCCYWLADRSGTVARFCYVSYCGGGYHDSAITVYGCAPMFRIRG